MLFASESGIYRRYGHGRASWHMVLPVAALGAAYLGGTGLKAMADAGLITEATPGSLAALSTAMSWEPAPWCPMTF